LAIAATPPKSTDAFPDKLAQIAGCQLRESMPGDTINVQRNRLLKDQPCAFQPK
jgi:hypothetical protein